MINILTLDDNPKKLQKIREVLTSIDGIKDENIDVVTDIISAKRLLIDNTYDILLLDIQIPNRIDQQAKINGGIEFLKELKRVKSKYNLPQHIIGITAYDESYLEANSEFDKNLYSLIKYDEKSAEWSDRIKNSVEHIIRSKSVIPSYRQEYEYDLAIICALQKEIDAIFKLASNWNELRLPFDSTTYYTTYFENDNKKISVVAAVAPQMGMTASAVLTTSLINNFKPNYLVMTGITAGIKGEVNLGDVLVADPSWDYGSGKIKEENNESVFYPDPQPIRLDSDVKSYLTNISNNRFLLESIKTEWPADVPQTSLKLHIGPVASGAAVLAHETLVESIKRHNRKLIGVEMETYGVLYAAAHCVKPRPIAFSIKSVCDFADSEKNDNFQKYAAYTSSNILKFLAMDYLDYENNVYIENPSQ